MADTLTAWRSRIIGHDSVDPRELTGNPKNHRTHPAHQREVVRDSIAELGFVKSVLVNKTTGYIIDGHERVWQALNAIEEDPTVTIDVEYVELSEAEEAKALAILDASTGLAIIDSEKLDDLLREVNTSSEAVSKMLADLAADTLPWLSDIDDDIARHGEHLDGIDVVIKVVVAQPIAGEAKTIIEKSLQAAGLEFECPTS